MTFTLEKYNGQKSRFTCPSCLKKKSFTRYINHETGEYLSEIVGRCNREIKCGYHYKPKDYFLDHPFENRPTNSTHCFKPVKRDINFIEYDLFNQYQKSLKSNLTTFLEDHFSASKVDWLIHRYYLTRSDYWNGATVFWQVDSCGKIRSGKVMLYDPNSGKRVKEPFNHITWVHSVENLYDFNLQQCFFGEHLLSEQKPIGIVESEKTALIAAGCYPELIWLASGSLSNLTKEKCKPLLGRNVTLFPDKGCLQNWQQKAAGLGFNISTTLEQSEAKAGSDIADYLF